MPLSKDLHMKYLHALATINKKILDFFRINMIFLQMFLDLKLKK